MPAEFEGWLGRILAIAATARQRPDEWRAVRWTWTPGARGDGSYVGDAAHPVEVRGVLLALQAACEVQLELAAADGDEPTEEFRQRIVDFVREETAAYIERVAPAPRTGTS